MSGDQRELGEGFDVLNEGGPAGDPALEGAPGRPGGLGRTAGNCVDERGLLAGYESVRNGDNPDLGAARLAPLAECGLNNGEFARCSLRDCEDRLVGTDGVCGELDPV